jgi:nitroreductase
MHAISIEPSTPILRAIADRHNISGKRLTWPGPNPEQIDQLFLAAAAAPDHGQKTPWRFIVIPADKRDLLGEAFASALAARDPTASAEQLQAARDKAHRAPLLIAVIARLAPTEAHIHELERMVSVGAAVQNVLLAATGMGFGSGLASGKAMASEHMRKLFDLAPGESAVCFINVGTVAVHRPMRGRPEQQDFVSRL